MMGTKSSRVFGLSHRLGFSLLLFSRCASWSCKWVSKERDQPNVFPVFSLIRLQTHPNSPSSLQGMEGFFFPMTVIPNWMYYLKQNIYQKINSDQCLFMPRVLPLISDGKVSPNTESGYSLHLKEGFVYETEKRFPV